MSDLLYEFGRNSGLVFQIQNDLFDIYSDIINISISLLDKTGMIRKEKLSRLKFTDPYIGRNN